MLDSRTIKLSAPVTFKVEVRSLVRQVSPDIQVLDAPEIANAIAMVGRPCVGFNFDWLWETLREHGREAVIFTAFHEVGHATDASPNIFSRGREYYADAWAARAMAGGGVPIDGALAFLSSARCSLLEGCTSHPDAQERVAHVRAVYDAAQAEGVLRRLVNELQFMSRTVPGQVW
jgi:hypothetical protein